MNTMKIYLRKRTISRGRIKKCMEDNDQNSSYTSIKLLKKIINEINNKNNKTLSTDIHKRLEDLNMYEKEPQISLTYE